MANESMTKSSRIGEIEARLAAAAQGPWELSTYTNYSGYSVSVGNHGCIAERWPAGGQGDHIEWKSIGDLIANAPTDIKYLLDQVTALTASRKQLRAALEFLHSKLDDGTLVRNIDDDHEPHFHLRMLEFVAKLKEGYDALTADEAELRGGG